MSGNEVLSNYRDEVTRLLAENERLRGEVRDLRATVQRVEGLAAEMEDHDANLCDAAAADARGRFDLMTEAAMAMQAADLRMDARRVRDALSGPSPPQEAAEAKGGGPAVAGAQTGTQGAGDGSDMEDEAQVGTCELCGQELILTADDCWHPWSVPVACPPQPADMLALMAWFQAGNRTGRPGRQHFRAAEDSGHGTAPEPS